jgi:glucan phosphoethanolaminetransferase (alkaline phosphatase superfamily)
MTAKPKSFSRDCFRALITRLCDRFFLFCTAVCLVFALSLMVWDFADSPVSGVKDLAIVVMQWGCLAVVASGLIVALMVNRVLFAVTFPILCVLTAVGAYYRATMGVMITPQVIELMVVNDTRTCMEVITVSLVVAVIVAVIVSVATVYVRWRFFKATIWRGTVAYVVAVAAFCFVFRGSLGESVMNRLPFSIYYGVEQYLVQRDEIMAQRDTFDDVEVKADDDSLTVVVILGESLRADHLALNGYERETTPRLSHDSAVISFSNVRTEPYFTHRSLPRILTRADSLHPDLASTEQSFITLFKRAGFKTTWISNQDSATPYAYFMHEADSLIQLSATASLYSYNKWLDRDIVKPLQGLIHANQSNSLYVIHTIGSHWWYPNHVTPDDEVFKPVVRSKVVSACTADEMRNSYDNTIIATDAFVSDVIELLRNRRAVILFISDHGECLGENGVFLHAKDAPELHHPACFVWYSRSYASRYPEKVRALESHASTPYSTDLIFHTVCSLGALNSSVIETKSSLCD